MPRYRSSVLLNSILNYQTQREAYKNRLAVADQVFAKAHDGAHMDANRKLVTAKVLKVI